MVPSSLHPHLISYISCLYLIKSYNLSTKLRDIICYTIDLNVHYKDVTKTGYLV